MLRLISALFTAAVVVGALAVWAYVVFQKPGPHESPRIVIVPKGAGLNQIAGLLETEGVIGDKWLFVAGVRAFDQAGSLKAGEYEVPARSSSRDIMDLLVSGKTVVHRLTVVEGTTVKQALSAVREADALAGEITDVPGEGEILAETYHFSRGDDRQALVDRMKAAMAETLDRLWAERAPDLPVRTKTEALTLASIVEKETAIAEERPRIAAVFLNRLRRGMRLQADPTVVYGLSDGEGAIDRALTRSDLDKATPYNTYTIDGLPPGPIAIPGRESIAAVLDPPATRDLYFVADGSGGHAFAETLAEHNRNVAKWRRIERKQNEN